MANCTPMDRSAFREKMANFVVLFAPYPNICSLEVVAAMQESGRGTWGAMEQFIYFPGMRSRRTSNDEKVKVMSCANVTSIELDSNRQNVREMKRVTPWGKVIAFEPSAIERCGGQTGFQGANMPFLLSPLTAGGWLLAWEHLTGEVSEFLRRRELVSWKLVRQEPSLFEVLLIAAMVDSYSVDKVLLTGRASGEFPTLDDYEVELAEIKATFPPDQVHVVDDTKPGSWQELHRFLGVEPTRSDWPSQGCLGFASQVSLAAAPASTLAKAKAILVLLHIIQMVMLAAVLRVAQQICWDAYSVWRRFLRWSDEIKEE